MSKLKIVKEFFEYIGHNKKLWLIPVIIILFIFAAAIIVSHSLAVSPFIFSLF